MKKTVQKKQEQIIEEAQVRTNKIHPNTPFRKQQELKANQKENTHLKQRSAFEFPVGEPAFSGGA